MVNHNSMTKAGLANAIQYHETELRSLRSIKVSCGSCDFYAHSNSFCTKFQAQPPGDFRAVGCDEWKHYDIPF